jgi:hypothetical protein
MECGRRKEIAKTWVEEVCRQYFHRHSDFVLYDADIKRFKCSECGSKKIEYLATAFPIETENTTKSTREVCSPVDGRRRYSPMHGTYGRGIRDE